MINKNDIKEKSILLINALEHKSFKMKMGYLTIESTETGKTISKHPYYSLLAIFVIGHTTLTSVVLEAFKKKGVSIVVLKPNFRIVYIYTPGAEANFLLRQKQYLFDDNLNVAKYLITNKIENQIRLLKNIRSKDEELKTEIRKCNELLENAKKSSTLDFLSAMEGNVSKIFFQRYFQEYEWTSRKPRVKQDYLNVILDIGYTFLFNFVDCMVNLFGFDTYKGVMHQLWFKRKSLVCDMVEPFRCIIDMEVRKALNLGQFQKKHFVLKNQEYRLKKGNEKIYMVLFVKALTDRKEDIFCYIRDYYRCFMGRKSVQEYPKFLIQ